MCVCVAKTSGHNIKGRSSGCLGKYNINTFTIRYTNMNKNFCKKSFWENRKTSMSTTIRVAMCYLFMSKCPRQVAVTMSAASWKKRNGTPKVLFSGQSTASCRPSLPYDIRAKSAAIVRCEVCETTIAKKRRTMLTSALIIIEDTDSLERLGLCGGLWLLICNVFVAVVCWGFVWVWSGSSEHLAFGQYK